MKLFEDVPLAPRTTLGVGGPARQLVEARSEPEIAEAVAFARRHRVDLFVLGGGSNIVVSDAGVEGLVVAIESRGIVFDRERVTAQAGEPWDRLVRATVERGLAGLECLSGIPGRVGATPIQNVGAYGQEVAESIEAVRVLERETGETRVLDKAACRFGYRDSFFKSEAPGRFIVLAVEFRLCRGGAPKIAYPDLRRELAARQIERPTLEDVRSAVLAVRASKSMLYDTKDENGRSCGSFFVNPVIASEDAARVRERAAGAEIPSWPMPDGRVKLSAAWLIEHAGLPKGTRDGAVGLSTKHALGVVAHDGARASDVVAFARRIRRTVLERFGVKLTPEPDFWGFFALDERLPDERL